MPPNTGFTHKTVRTALHVSEEQTGTKPNTVWPQRFIKTQVSLINISLEEEQTQLNIGQRGDKININR